MGINDLHIHTMYRKPNRKTLVIVGPTASGKSALAATLARAFNGEIVSADSRQVYRGLNVGTGKITKKEMSGVTHHLLDVANPKKQFTVAEYQKLAREKIEDILSRGKLPIVVGGTGLYLDAALGRIAIPEVPPNSALRKKLEKKSITELFVMIQKLDPQRAKTIDAHNLRRLVRAIEIATTNEGKALQHPILQSALAKVRFDILWLGLTLQPEELKKKIAIRLFFRLRQDFSGQARIEKDMITEVKRLHKCGLSWKRMEALGLEYRYLSRYLRGLLTETEMTEKLQTEIYRYAKRQMTWFKRNKEIRWFRPSQRREIFAMLKGEGL